MYEVINTTTLQPICTNPLPPIFNTVEVLFSWPFSWAKPSLAHLGFHSLAHLPSLAHFTTKFHSLAHLPEQGGEGGTWGEGGVA